MLETSDGNTGDFCADQDVLTTDLPRHYYEHEERSVSSTMIPYDMSNGKQFLKRKFAINDPISKHRCRTRDIHDIPK